MNEQTTILRSSPGRPKPRVVAVASALLLSTALVGCAQQETIEPRELVRPVKTMTIGSDDLGVAFEYPGFVDATLNAQVSFEVPGLITEILVREGQRVQAGQVLARLDPQDYEAQRDAVLARVNEAWADYQRYQQLYAADAASVQELDLSRRSHEVAASQLRIAQKAVDDTELRARFAGTVSRRLREEFENVQAKEPVFVVQDEDQLEIKFNIPESDAATWQMGSSVTTLNDLFDIEVALTARPEYIFSADITEMATTADPVTRTFEVTLGFRPDERIAARTGMTAIVRASGTAPDQVYLIPAVAALGDESGNSYVWRIDPSSMRAARTPVQVGEISGDRIAVLAGLSNGDVIAIAGARALAEGMQVRELTRQ